MPTILLVRHATTPTTGTRLYGRKPGVHLDDRGRVQAQATAAHLAEPRLTAIYASPLERTQETARIIAKPHGLRIRTREGLNEVDYGEWTDRALGQLRRRKDWAVIQDTPSRFTFPGGESLRGAQARFVDAIEQIADAHREKDRLAVVSHADLIRMAIAHYSGATLDHFQRLVVSPASVSTIHLAHGGRPIVLSTNVVPPSPPSEPAKAPRTA